MVAQKVMKSGKIQNISQSRDVVLRMTKHPAVAGRKFRRLQRIALEEYMYNKIKEAMRYDGKCVAWYELSEISDFFDILQRQAMRCPRHGRMQVWNFGLGLVWVVSWNGGDGERCIANGLLSSTLNFSKNEHSSFGHKKPVWTRRGFHLQVSCPKMQFYGQWLLFLQHWLSINYASQTLVFLLRNLYLCEV